MFQSVYIKDIFNPCVFCLIIYEFQMRLIMGSFWIKNMAAERKQIAGLRFRMIEMHIHCSFNLSALIYFPSLYLLCLFLYFETSHLFLVTMRQENVHEGTYSLPACMQGKRISSCQVHDERQHSTHTVTPNRQSSDKYSSSQGGSIRVDFQNKDMMG